MKAAVLGATGFVGRALVPALAERMDVTAISRSGDAPAVEHVQPVAADALEPESLRRALDGAEIVYYLDQNEHIGAVDVTTVVGAKGLSADHVIVLGCDDVNMAWVSRNAFFVAITRARKSLTLIACIGGGGASILHPFVCSLPDEHTRAIYAKASAAEEIESIGTLQGKLERWAYARAHRS